MTIWSGCTEHTKLPAPGAEEKSRKRFTTQKRYSTVCQVLGGCVAKRGWPAGTLAHYDPLRANSTAWEPSCLTQRPAVCPAAPGRLTQVLGGCGAQRGGLRGAACAGRGRTSCAGGGRSREPCATTLAVARKSCASRAASTPACDAFGGHGKNARRRASSQGVVRGSKRQRSM